MSRRGNIHVVVFELVSLLALLACIAAQQTRPNMVILMADDLGIGDVGCFGNATIQTPNIDGICARGARLSQHVTADAMCTPSRSAFLTGRLPVRTGMASSSRLAIIPALGYPGGLPPNETTFPKLLQRAGYNTALIGKWHLGVSCKQYGDNCHHPNNHGFHYFFGLPLTNYRNLYNDSNVLWEARPALVRGLFITGGILALSTLFLYVKGKSSLAVASLIVTVLYTACSLAVFTNLHVLNSNLMRNGEVVEQPIHMENLAPRLVNEGIRFLEQQSEGQQPFLLFMSWVQVHTALHASQKFQGHSSHGPYGDEVEEMDWSVGQIVGALEKLGLLDNTIVYFTSDNGGHIEERHGHHRHRTGGHNGIYRGSKSQGGQEGGIRVPTAIAWKGQIPPGGELSTPTSQMDMFTTLLDAAGIEPPTDRTIDGVDLWPLLRKAGASGPGVVAHEFMFHYCGIWLHAVRYTPGNGDDVYKVYYYMPNWEEGSGDGCPPFMCTCAEDHTKLTVPRVTNVARDPREVAPLEPATPTYRAVLGAVEKAVKEHEKTLTPVPSQMNFGWRPSLQPCCSWKFCTCSDDTQNALNYVPPWERKG